MIKEEYDYFFETLANKRRLKIIDLLRTGPKSVLEIVEKSGLEQSNVSHNLKRLEYCGFVKAKPNGKQRIYSLNKETIEPLMQLIDKHTNKFCIHCITERRNEAI